MVGRSEKKRIVAWLLTFILIFQGLSWNGLLVQAQSDVTGLTLFPDPLYIHVGNSYYVQPTVEPADAVYDKIDWSSNSNATVSVNEDGLVTANSVGTASITAVIGEKDCVADVRVYEITSNLEKEADRKAICDEMGKLLDDFFGEELSDLGKTDISTEDVEVIMDGLREAICREDQIRVDLSVEEKSVSEIADDWNT